ncbi:FTR1 family protein [Paenibacillus chitinolyticus]|uniref:FTR1 family iron permease n=1 Tax=Paenibacillus chitinolyticus TaxID=79263 RepID=UPI0035585F54
MATLFFKRKKRSLSLTAGRSVFKIGLAALLLLISVTAAGTGYSPAFAAGGSKASGADGMLPVVGGALVEAGQGSWAKAAEHLAEADKLWQANAAKSSAAAADVNSALAHAKRTVAEGDKDPKAATAALSELAKAVNKYAKEGRQDTQTGQSGQDTAASLLPVMKKLAASIQSGDLTQAYNDYKTLNNGWLKVEQAIRSDNFTVYSGMETQMSMIRVALQAEPKQPEQAASETAALIQLVNDYTAGKIVSKAPEPADMSVAELIGILDQASSDIAAGHHTEAAGQMQAFIQKWPSAEGQVRIRSAAVYTQIENQMTEASRYLMSVPPAGDKAKEVIAAMREQLQPMTGEKRYTAVDAGLILLREGLEAILVISALLAYLKRTGNGDKRRWIWSGVGSGLLLSGAMAFLLSYMISQAASGSTREFIEGGTGLLSVVLMLTVGNWLHAKSNVKAWNSYIDRQMGSALAGGSLWSLFAVSLLAILREGAETTIFYVGMAPSIAPSQLFLGIGVTLLLLIGIGFAIIRLSAKLPIRPFFITASALIYYLVFRFLGESIHSLQVASAVPAHSASGLPSVDWLGIYPTWETLLPQLALLAYIAAKLLRSRSGKASSEPALTKR